MENSAEKMVILADINCDLSPELRAYFGIEEYIQGHVHFSDGREIMSKLDWSNIDRESFYKDLSGTKVKISTSPLSPDEYYVIFEKHIKEGRKVLSMSVSSKVSSTFNSAHTACERIKKDYPDSEIYAFDSYRTSGGFGMLVCQAAEMRKNGKSFKEIIDWLEANKNTVHQMGPIDDLMFVARRGRISTGKAIMGSFAGVKPMGDCNSNGYVTVLTKAKGIKKALDITVKYIKETAKDIENSYIIVTHSGREMYAQTLGQMIEEQLKPKKVFVGDVFCGSGTNIGPGMVCAYYLGDEISEDLVAEKEVMNKIVGK
ncbi:MAG: DegV family EDD domain-containing protein [Ruminococcaceae bacterium]|nr:DegV family EDD domain-containing protein [Oscillospiraceae bacterium]